ncbi:MAG: DNA metabolism protein [Flavobacterium sp.]|nr:MAG: DNA metabolism protein [Flavobacterium sp.]
MTTYLFDATFEGLLTSVFDFYDLKPESVRVIAANGYEPALLDVTHTVISDEEKARRVWDGLKKKLSGGWPERIFTCFLSERAETFQDIFDFIRYIFDNPKGAEVNFGNRAVIALTKMEKSVSRERHRMKAFTRFQQTADGIFYAPVEPDFNVLPLIASFFKNRYADQQWIIYDVRRKYGLFYDLNEISEIRFDEVPELKAQTTFLQENALNEKEELYSLLWADYFKSTNIPARKNLKLHIRHVPKRYWKFLTEKKGVN